MCQCREGGWGAAGRRQQQQQQQARWGMRGGGDTGWTGWGQVVGTTSGKPRLFRSTAPMPRPPPPCPASNTASISGGCSSSSGTPWQRTTARCAPHPRHHRREQVQAALQHQAQATCDARRAMHCHSFVPSARREQMQASGFNIRQGTHPIVVSPRLPPAAAASAGLGGGGSTPCCCCCCCACSSSTSHELHAQPSLAGTLAPPHPAAPARMPRLRGLRTCLEHSMA